MIKTKSLKYSPVEFKRLKAQNRKLFKSMDYIMVIQANFFYFNAHHQINIENRSYNWHVDHRTGDIKDAKVGGLAVVKNDGKKGKRSVVIITKIIKAKGSVAKKMASKLNFITHFCPEHLDKKTRHIVKER